MIMTNMGENEIQQELPRVRAYIGDYLINGVADPTDSIGAASYALSNAD